MVTEADYARRDAKAAGWIMANQSIRGEGWSEHQCLEDVMDAYAQGFADRETVIGAYGRLARDWTEDEATAAAEAIIDLLGDDTGV